MEGFVFVATGLEHTEDGLPDYSPKTHTDMSEKRHRKILSALQDLPNPEELFGEEPLDVGVIAWGSTFGSALEAVRKGRKKGYKVGVLKVVSLYPFHEGPIRTFMKRCRQILIPELNYEGQLANLIGHLNGKDVVRLNRVTGTPMGASLISDKIESMMRPERNRDENIRKGPGRKD
jgi:2-oxoglutarate ferredoxin oxidoreductase subunit alpha